MDSTALADYVRLLHAGWVGFVLLGFFWTLSAFFFHRRFFDYFWFRTVHLLAAVSATLLPILGLYCPLTFLEFSLRVDLDTFPTGGFILYYLGKLLGNPAGLALFVRLATWTIFLTTVAAYFLRPPERAERWFERVFSSRRKPRTGQLSP
ncbi:MAG TPA: DUF2784 family protein [Verrucomicrobiae bacterium]|nr:DUF2784 family protein [Verrucomicrobiae bacterium]